MRFFVFSFVLSAAMLHWRFGPIAGIAGVDRSFVIAALGSVPLLIWGHWHAYLAATWFLTMFGCATDVLLHGIAAVPIQMLVWCVGFTYLRKDGRIELHLEYVPKWILTAVWYAIAAPLAVVTFLAFLSLPLMGLWISLYPLLGDMARYGLQIAPWLMLGACVVVLIRQGALVEQLEETSPPATLAPRSGVFLQRTIVIGTGCIMIAAGLTLSAIVLRHWIEVVRHQNGASGPNGPCCGDHVLPSVGFRRKMNRPTACAFFRDGTRRLGATGARVCVLTRTSSSPRRAQAQSRLPRRGTGEAGA